MLAPVLITAGILGALAWSARTARASSTGVVPASAPGYSARVGDEVEVPITAAPGILVGLSYTIPPDADLQTLFVTITQTEPRIRGDIRGVVTGISFGRQGSFGRALIPNGPTTPFFSRLYVRRVFRGGQAVA